MTTWTAINPIAKIGGEFHGFAHENSIAQINFKGELVIDKPTEIDAIMYQVI